MKLPQFTDCTTSAALLRRELRSVVRLLLIIAFLTAPSSFYSAPVLQSAPNIGVNGSLSANKIQRGRTVQATVVMDIPSGYHVNSNRPLEKFLIATQVKVEAPKGIPVGPVSYPRAVLRSFKFSKNRVSVYEGRATMRFNVAVSRDASPGSKEKVWRRYYPCLQPHFEIRLCFPTTL